MEEVRLVEHEMYTTITMSTEEVKTVCPFQEELSVLLQHDRERGQKRNVC